MHWFMEHWHTLVTVCAAAVIGTFLVAREVRHYFHRGSERPPADPNAFLIGATCILVIFLAARVEQVSHRVTEDLDALRSASEKDSLVHFKTLTERLNRNLAKVHGGDFKEQLDTVLKAIESGEVVINDIDKVRELYVAMLPKFGKAEFYSTSVPTRAYFWGDPKILEAMEVFITKHKGKMTRVFFLTDSEPSTEAAEIMSEQARIGVAVYYTPVDALPNDLNKLYFVGANENIAWKIDIDPLKKVNQITTTIRQDDIDRYRKNFRRILELKDTKKFELPES